MIHDDQNITIVFQTLIRCRSSTPSWEIDSMKKSTCWNYYQCYQILEIGSIVYCAVRVFKRTTPAAIIRIKVRIIHFLTFLRSCVPILLHLTDLRCQFILNMTLPSLQGMQESFMWKGGGLLVAIWCVVSGRPSWLLVLACRANQVEWILISIWDMDLVYTYLSHIPW